ncbi:putative Leucine-rich repeat protein kinase family protein [Hibiscus syriacus]|uniref:Leucine-rich repeat protein kinase family protein n=1 Tax=Hibiscus syriacus TaxID=106335 RepID=A0A6A3CDJ8_HIBSY|nr:aspartyl protease family protein At5g10770-like [Hibiscus syriacus]KAE8725262.1 putative Leucine-rich repeat protein kinase family protein [Hibiscus syriacus]
MAISFFFFLLLCSFKNSYGFLPETATVEIMDLPRTHSLQTTSLLPSTVCKSSPKGMKERSSIPIVNKLGPCWGLSQDKENLVPSHAEVLRQDKARADSIHSMLSSNFLEKTSLQDKPGISIGTGKYQVGIGFGQSNTKLSLVFDTASQLTWTQCQPCSGYCYDQKDPIFNPLKSSSYASIRCPSVTCNQISSEGMQKGCSSSSTCIYGVTYTYTTFSVGFLARETISLTSSDVFRGFLFGCGQRNRFPNGRNAAGVLGLGRGWFSIVSQTSKKYHKVFSYCLPSSDESAGYLKFGDRNLPSSIKFTPMSKSFEGTNYYGLDIVDIGVGGERLSIDRSVFSTSGTVIDSASLITRLPPAAYSRVRRSFVAKMTNYPTAPAFENLGTCYDFSGNSTVVMPTITLYFDGGVEMPIDARGILYINKISQACLAFAKNNEDDDVMIVGNFQQKGYEVVYDDANGRVGFAAGSCS